MENKIVKKTKELWNYFTTYEKIWFFSILILAVIFAFLFPEEDVNGINGSLIMGLYLADTFLNILCELLISKQSKWNFIVSLFGRDNRNRDLHRFVLQICDDGVHALFLDSD